MKRMAMGPIFGAIADVTMEPGRTISVLEREPLCGPLSVVNMMANGKTTSVMATEDFIGKTGISMKENGRMGEDAAKANSSQPLDTFICKNGTRRTTLIPRIRETSPNLKNFPLLRLPRLTAKITITTHTDPSVVDLWRSPNQTVNKEQEMDPIAVVIREKLPSSILLLFLKQTRHTQSLFHPFPVVIAVVAAAM